MKIVLESTILSGAFTKKQATLFSTEVSIISYQE